MIISNTRRMIKAADVARLPDGSLVSLRCDPRVRQREFGTEYYRVTTRNGLKVLIRRDPPHVIKTIWDRPGRYFCREVY